MARKLNLIERLQLFWEMHWIKVILGLILIGAIIWPIFTLSNIDSYQRTYLLALMSMTPLQSIFYTALFGVMIWYIHYGGVGFGKTNTKKTKANTVNVKWDDVVGMDEAKKEAWEIIELLKDHKKLQEMGGRAIKGLLLSGPPGCGKTYLAKAIATEADLPFMAVSGSEFIEVFVGTGPARVRGIFKKARQLARVEGGAIIFIDELDAVGTSRSSDLGFGAQTERNNTVNELLVQMDGLSSSQYNIVVIGATNASEATLDSALLRPGRLDRKIHVDRPGLQDREKLFEYYLKKVKTSADVNLQQLARRTVWKSAAEIENTVKEAALIAARDKRKEITYKDISAALERIDLGFKINREMNEEDRRWTAYHEAGHALVAYLLHPTDDVFKASIVSRRNTLGVVYHVPREERFTKTRDELIADIKTALGGFAAEKLVFGRTSTGVSSDFHKAMLIAHDMVWKFGMGSNGFIGNYEALIGSSMFRGAGSGDKLSERMKEKLNEETHQILAKCIKEVDELLTQERDLLDDFVNELLKKQELEYDEIEEIFVRHGKKRLFPKLAVGNTPTSKEDDKSESAEEA